MYVHHDGGENEARLERQSGEVARRRDDEPSFERTGTGFASLGIFGEERGIRRCRNRIYLRWDLG
jgi:hypothetical protein